jgi:RNA polymerase sigma-70 factor (ECF subfamily)
LKRFQDGDPDAFTEIYRLHQKPVFRFGCMMTGDTVKAAEATQDVFVWLIHHPRDFDPLRGELSSFLVGVARKLLLRRYTEEKRWVPIDDSAPHRMDWLGIRDCNKDQEEEDLGRLRRAIAPLPERYRAVVVLCDLEGKTYDQAAVMIECAVGTVRSRLHRARALLSRKLVGKGCTA